jgi:hypothetical protein
VPEEVRLWDVQPGNNLRELDRSRLDLEDRLESWLADDISILSSDLLIIGKQVRTDFDGIIDLLCLNGDGDCVIVELKRHKTPREVTAQVLDYASWVSELGEESIISIANEYLNERGPLEKVFTEKFKREFPETLNENHGMLVVASEIDQSSERIIKYLSDAHGISINAATFNYFRSPEGGELLARIFLIEPGQVEDKQRAKSASKRQPYPSYEKLRQQAEENGVGELFHSLESALDSYFYKHTTRTSLAFTHNFEGSWKAIFSLSPSKSSPDDGLYFQIYFQRFLEYSNLDREAALALLPRRRESWKYYKDADADFSGYAGFFKDAAEVETFLRGVARLPKR